MELFVNELIKEIIIKTDKLIMKENVLYTGPITNFEFTQEEFNNLPQFGYYYIFGTKFYVNKKFEEYRVLSSHPLILESLNTKSVWLKNEELNSWKFLDQDIIDGEELNCL